MRLGEAATRAGDPKALETIRQGAELAEACGADATLIRAALATTRGSLRSLWSGEQLAIVEAAVARAERRRPRDPGAPHRAPRAEPRAHGPDRSSAGRGAGGPRARAVEPRPHAAGPGGAGRAVRALDTRIGGVREAELAAEATAIADEANDPHLAFVVHHVSYGAAVCVGDATAAARYLGRLHEIADEIGEPTMRWHVGILDAYVATMDGPVRRRRAHRQRHAGAGDADRRSGRVRRLRRAVLLLRHLRRAPRRAAADRPADDRHRSARRAAVPGRPCARVLRGRPAGGGPGRAP